MHAILAYSFSTLKIIVGHFYGSAKFPFANSVNHMLSSFLAMKMNFGVEVLQQCATSLLQKKKRMTWGAPVTSACVSEHDPASSLHLVARLQIYTS